MVDLPEPSGPAYRLCFVCSGNICRSPIAAVVMQRLVDDAGLTDVVQVDSAGTGDWHVGDRADHRAVAALRDGGYDGRAHRARVFEPGWLADRDLVLALDRGHLRELRALARTDEQRDRVRLLRSFDPTAPEGAEVADPYFGDARDFAEVLDQVERACRGLLDAIAELAADDTGSMTPFEKSRSGAPPGFFAVEAAGLAWLGAVDALRVGRVVEVAADRLLLDRVVEVPPTASAAEQLGHGLALVHRAGAAHHGAPPDGWTGDGFIATLPLPHLHHAGPGWAEFYVGSRLSPYVGMAADRGALDDDGVRVIERVMSRLVDGRLSVPDVEPARLHGDLWSGNVLWSADGAVLIDPAAHGGHRETDLAMLDLFGLPHLDRVLAAYDETWPLDDGWRQRVPLHQLHPLLVHAALFGGGYGAHAVTAARRYA